MSPFFLLKELFTPFPMVGVPFAEEVCLFHLRVLDCFSAGGRVAAQHQAFCLFALLFPEYCRSAKCHQAQRFLFQGYELDVIIWVVMMGVASA